MLLKLYYYITYFDTLLIYILGKIGSRATINFERRELGSRVGTFLVGSSSDSRDEIDVMAMQPFDQMYSTMVVTKNLATMLSRSYFLYRVTSQKLNRQGCWLTRWIVRTIEIYVINGQLDFSTSFLPFFILFSFVLNRIQQFQINFKLSMIPKRSKNINSRNSHKYMNQSVSWKSKVGETLSFFLFL